MKKWITMLLAIIIVMLLNACSSNKQYVDETLTTNVDIKADELTVITQSNPDIVIDTEYYTLSTPSSWEDDCFYEITDGESYSYNLSFYDKASYDAINGGWLFSIKLLTEFEDYSVYPNYDVLGSLEVYRIGLYNIVVIYPTDVQYSEETAWNYNQLSAQIPSLLKTIDFKEECNFSEDPLPIVNNESSQESLSADFYFELCNYTILSCVNYTEWWSNPTLSYTNPTHYYLGKITSDNYSEKMQKAKQLVDSVYRARYWEICHNGYGKIKIGLYITSEDELYFCYK